MKIKLHNKRYRIIIDEKFMNISNELTKISICMDYEKITLNDDLSKVLNFKKEHILKMLIMYEPYKIKINEN